MLWSLAASGSFLTSMWPAQERSVLAGPPAPVAAAQSAPEFEGVEPGCAGSLNPEASTWWLEQGGRFTAGRAKPLGAQARATVGVALAAALDRETDRDTVPCLLAALATAAPDDEATAMRLARALAGDDPRVGAAAALALGLTRRSKVVPTLLDLFADAAQDVRTRAFAAYGAASALDAGVELDVAAAVVRVAGVRLSAPEGDPDLDTAAVHLLRSLHVDRASTDTQALLDRALDLLWSFHDRGDGARIHARAHVASAVARLLERAGDPGEVGRSRLCAALRSGDDRHDWPLGVAAAQALGALCEGEPSAMVEAALRDAAVRGRNPQARGLCRLALGRIGSEGALRFLLSDLANPDDFDVEWTLLALGVATRGRRPLPEALRAEIGARILATSRGTRDRSYGMRLLALGAARHPPAIPVLIATLRAARPNRWTSYMTNHAAEAVVLLDAREAAEAVRDIDAEDDAQTYLQFARIRRQSGDLALVEELLAAIRGLHVARSWAASLALAELGDAGVRALVELLEDPTPALRQTAAHSLMLAAAAGSPVATLRRDISYRFLPRSLEEVLDLSD